MKAKTLEQVLRKIKTVDESIEHETQRHIDGWKGVDGCLQRLW